MKSICTLLNLISILNLINVAICLQDNLDSNLANVDLDNPLVQLNRELLKEKETLNLIRNFSNYFSLKNNTQDVIEKVYDRSCFSCLTTDDPNCEKVNLTRNNEFIKKCKPNQPFCSTLRIEYKTIKEANWSLWMLERSCQQNCEPICIQLGERTRLRYCNECCNKSLCNIGNYEQNIQSNLLLIILSILFIYLI